MSTIGIDPRLYEVRIAPHDLGYIAVVPELPGCMSDGETPEEALANGYDAAGAWIEAAREMGREVPTPMRRAYA